MNGTQLNNFENNNNFLGAALNNPDADYSEQENKELSETYDAIAKSGVGGCAVVYDGWRKGDGLHVAIKVLSVPITVSMEEAKDAKVRFYHEARILMNLQNENTVRCVDYGVFHGAPSVVMEFVEGEGLDQYLNDFGALPFDYSVGIASQILGALGEAHEYGVIHRDIKPANIMIINGSEPPVARLLDFGIASFSEGALGDHMKSKLNSVRGTPAYMAPELFSGEIPATPESDI